MAKISANGATKVAEVRAKNPATGSLTVYVLCSDGRVLSRMAGDSGTGYTVMTRKVGVKPGNARSFLEALAQKHRLTVVS